MAATRLSAGFEFGSVCDSGRMRDGQSNQDAVQLVLPGPDDVYPPLLLVADGMGGYGGGAVASRLVIQGMKDVYLRASHPADPGRLLQDGLQTAHRLIRARGEEETGLDSMGSTLAAAVLTPERIYSLNVGDSRVYLLRGRQIVQLSQDQSWVAEQVRAGLLTPEQALRHPRRSRLSMAVSAKRASVQGYLNSVALEVDDVLVLCTDGLWSVVPEALIWAAARELDPQTAAEKLVGLANANGGPDNISVVIARRHWPGRKSSSADLDETVP
ncbi:MAG: protein phosphatase 2C domain-containing protein [Anaerolineales bacterium]